MKNESKTREESRDASWIAGAGICNETYLKQQEHIPHVSYNRESMLEINLVEVRAHQRRNK